MIKLTFASEPRDLHDELLALVGSYDELRDLAIENLLNRLPKIERRGDNTLSYLLADEFSEATLMLVDTLWNKENFPVNGDIVVFVPTRDLIIITGSDDEEGLRKAREFVNSTQWPYEISPHPFVRADDTWQRFRQ